MTEDEAQSWVRTKFGDDSYAQLDRLVELVRAEAINQNLVAASTLEAIWARHIVDSAQLLDFVIDNDGPWLDIGTGAGFPGLVVAILREQQTILVEPRRRRADFLTLSAGSLGLSARVAVVASKVESVKARATVISARAVAQIGVLFASAAHCATPDTLWLLPKGLRAREEVAQAREAWHGVFHVEHSITDPNSLIVIASKVSRR